MNLLFFLMTKLLLILFLFLSNIALSNESISKLNRLYFDGVIDSQTFINSLKKLNSNLEDDQIKDLLILYSEGVLDENAFENSILNYFPNQTSNQKLNSPKNTSLRSKKYIISNCVGDVVTCTELKSGDDTEIIFDGENFRFSNDFKDDLINSPSFVQFVKEESKIENDTFKASMTLTHFQGFLFNIVGKGKIEKDDFDLRTFEIIVNGNVIIRGKFEEST